MKMSPFNKGYGQVIIKPILVCFPLVFVVYMLFLIFYRK